MPQAVDKEVIVKVVVDDSKEYKVIKSIKDCPCLQRVLLNLLVWFTLWQLKLNIDKCLVLPLGRVYPMFLYTINATKGSRLSCRFGYHPPKISPFMNMYIGCLVIVIVNYSLSTNVF